MEVHLVHKKADGSLAVVGVLIEKGEENQALKAVFDSLPQQKGPEATLANTIVNPLHFLPKDRGYYTYQGSLTTPPCSENVDWYVMEEKIELSSDQIAKFKQIFSMNARQPQPLFKRVIKEKD